jgi:hypothetical protein
LLVTHDWTMFKSLFLLVKLTPQCPHSSGLSECELWPQQGLCERCPVSSWNLAGASWGYYPPTKHGQLRNLGTISTL